MRSICVPSFILLHASVFEPFIEPLMHVNYFVKHRAAQDKILINLF